MYYFFIKAQQGPKHDIRLVGPVHGLVDFPVVLPYAFPSGQNYLSTLFLRNIVLRIVSRVQLFFNKDYRHT